MSDSDSDSDGEIPFFTAGAAPASVKPDAALVDAVATSGSSLEESTARREAREAEAREAKEAEARAAAERDAAATAASRRQAAEEAGGPRGGWRVFESRRRRGFSRRSAALS